MHQSTVTRSGAEILLQALKDQGVEVIFGYPGGAVLPIYDAIFQQNAIRHILVRHEQAAVHAAEGYARSTGRVGVVLVTSGPGATNAVTGLVDALMDSVPIVCLTGQVPTHLIGNDAFQEADTTGITRPATKHNYLVKRGEDLARVVHEAFYVARSGRPGPVVIDLPKDILIGPAPYTAASTEPHRSYRPRHGARPGANPPRRRPAEGGKTPDRLFRRRRHQRGPDASVGADRTCPPDRRPLYQHADGPGRLSSQRPAVPRHAGDARHGRGQPRHAWLRRDAERRRPLRRPRHRPAQRLLAVREEDPLRHRPVQHQQERDAVDVPVVGDAGRILRAHDRRLARRHGSTRTAPRWPPGGARSTPGARPTAWRYEQDPAPTAIIKPQHAIRRLHAANCAGRDTFISTEVGQHQMWAAQHFGFEQPNRWMTSGGLGTMGYGLPAAMGVQVAHPDALCIDVAGEASILMNIQEMATLAQYRLPVKVFILNNQYMGMVRQWQELLHGSRYSESHSTALPDFVKLADAFGATGLRATKLGELDDVIARMLATPGPVIADICVDETENVLSDDPVRRGAQRDDPRRWPGRARGRADRRRVDAGLMSGEPASGLQSATISVLVENESGVLARVIGLFSGRGYNIESLTVAPVSDDNGRSRINVVTSGTEMVIAQIKAQLAPPGAGL